MRLSVQLYTVREALSKDLAGTLAQIKEIGLEYVELAGDYGKSAAEWKEMLDSLGLKVSASHTGIDALKGDLDKVIADTQTLGYKYVVIPWVGEDIRSMGWDEFARSIEPIATKLKEAGLTLAYHNHDFEFQNGGLDLFYATAPADLVKAQLDLAWVKIGGEDPAAYIRKHADRTPLVHLKDFDPTKTPQWTPAGEGTMDYDSILAACQEAGVEFGSIELDESPEGDEVGSVRKSYEFLSSKGLR